MDTIWKFPLEIADYQKISIPLDAQILSVQVQKGVPCLWVRLDPEMPRRDRIITIRGTGHNLSDLPLSFIGTFQLENGDLVFHVFEL